MSTGQLFSRSTQALFYNYKQSPVQRMLDFDFLCGRDTPSVAGIVNPGSEGFQKLFFGQEEIAVPVHGSIQGACKAHPTADVFINFASFRSAYASSMEALKQPTIRVIAIIAEGVPEGDTKKLITHARINNKVIIGPATVGGIQAGAFKIGDTAGTLENIIHCKLYRPGSVGFVSKSVSFVPENSLLLHAEAQHNFENLKESMATAPVLKIVDTQEPFDLETDASGIAVDQEGRPIDFESKNLTPAQR